MPRLNVGHANDVWQRGQGFSSEDWQAYHGQRQVWREDHGSSKAGLASSWDARSTKAEKQSGYQGWQDAWCSWHDGARQDVWLSLSKGIAESSATVTRAKSLMWVLGQSAARGAQFQDVDAAYRTLAQEPVIGSQLREPRPSCTQRERAVLARHNFGPCGLEAVFASSRRVRSLAAQSRWTAAMYWAWRQACGFLGDDAGAEAQEA